MSSRLNINGDEIEDYEYTEYLPISGTSLNRGGEIRISIETKDIFTHPYKSYLQFSGTLTKADGTPYGDNDLVSLTNDAMMYLFNEIRLNLGSTTIETSRICGQSNTMLKAALKETGPNDLASGWVKDTSNTAALTNQGFATRQSWLIKTPTTKGAFQFIVPLSDILGFAADYEGLLYGMRQELVLVRKTDADAVFRDAAVAAAKVTLNNISWMMPHVTPTLEKNVELLKVIESKTSIPVEFRRRQCETISVPQTTELNWNLSAKSSSEKPRYVLIAFQTNRSNDETKNASAFDHCNLTRLTLFLSDKKYPRLDYELDWDKNEFSRSYDDFVSFKSSYYDIDSLLVKPGVGPSDYKSLYPIFVIDCSKQSERLKNATIDMRIKAVFKNAVPANTSAFACCISDRLCKLQSDGNKFSVIY